MRFLVSLVWLLAGALGLAGASHAASPLVSPAELKALADAGQVRIVDVRDAEAYALQHLPGAVSAPYARWRGPAANPGLVPPLKDLTALVQELGLTPEQRTVLVYTGTDSSDFATAARAYWTLKSLGARELSILNGGLNAWRGAGFAVSDQAAHAQRSSWQPQFNPQWLATRAEVRQLLGSDQAVLVDSRPAPFFQGRIAHDAAKARGTLPGAVNIDSDLYFELGSAVLMDKASLEAEADAAHAAPGQTVVTFCNAGHWSATDWFVRSELLGQPKVKLYPGSVIDWSQAPEPLPMTNEPSRIDKLRHMLATWAQRNLHLKTP
ncbi:sulfurtransferase [Ottowia beijingensis]|uniref:sulfurtransferase n=1 Tax=Ottowia beijingensis TaxID=1207057 RepID=UPI002FD93990